MDTAALQLIADVVNKGGNLSMFVIVYFAWISYRTLTRIEVMLEIALRERGAELPEKSAMPFVRRRPS